MFQAYSPRVLHIQKVAGIAGSENHLLTLLPRLRDYGYDPSMLVLADPEDRPAPFVERMRSSDVTTDLISMSRDVDPLLLIRLAQYTRRRGVDLVHTHLFHADLYGAFASLLAGTSHLVSTKHGFNPWRRQRFYAFLDRLAASFQQRIITISNAIGQWLVEVEGLPSKKMRTIYYGLDVQQFHPNGEESPALVGVSRPVIGTVTRLMHQKGVHVLIEAFASCLKQHPQASLVIVGGGPVRLDLEKQADSLGLGERVHFLGYVSHPALCQVIDAFDLFAFPTFGEGFGLVLLEAMSLGKPVVASKVMAIPEIVVHGQTGLLVPPNDPAALAEALLQFLSDPELRRQSGLTGRQRVEHEFTVERMVRQTVGVYDEVLGRVSEFATAGNCSEPAGQR